MPDENKVFHQRLRRHKGPASDQKCATCPEPAYEWAYQHTDPEPYTDSNGGLYSLGYDHYKPMCRSCHRKLDIRMNPANKTRLVSQISSAWSDPDEMRRRGRMARRHKKHDPSCSRRMATRDGVRRCPCGGRKD